MNEIYQPIVFRLSNPDDLNSFEELKLNDSSIVIYDTIVDQLIELYKVRHPAKITYSQQEIDCFVNSELNGCKIDFYGTWVYYPWSNRLIHLLDQNEYFDVRTNRNNTKISLSEQQVLRNKTIGIVGLSVGQSVALTIAMERICGKLRLADFDTVELSNLNRIRTSVHNLGLPKVVIVAREIAEIDPYLEIDIFPEGLNDSNMDAFLMGAKKVDVLIELCDSIDVKISCRIAARKYHIPVVMETNDRCMVDIERYDLDPQLGILHGLVTEEELSNFKNLTAAERLGLVLKIVDKERLSSKMLEAFSQIGKTIRSWPQLASSVTMGGGITTDIVRRILLEEVVPSGRWYFDVEDTLNNESVVFTNY